MTVPLPAALLMAAVIAVVVAGASWRLRFLTIDGAIAAALVGSLVLGFAGWPLAGVLAIFFGSSSILTRYRATAKPHREHGQGRSAAQVAANGVIPAALAVLWGTLGSPWTLAGAAGALAASTADTWATEIGLLSSSPVRLITTLRVVQRGRSGGITLLGTAAGIAGASIIAVAAAGVLRAGALRPGAVSIATAGWAGMVADSLLGAGLQASYICAACSRSGETPRCRCGGRARHVQGLRWMTNDVVNVLASLVGAAVAAAL